MARRHSLHGFKLRLREEILHANAGRAYVLEKLLAMGDPTAKAPEGEAGKRGDEKSMEPPPSAAAPAEEEEAKRGPPRPTLEIAVPGGMRAFELVSSHEYHQLEGEDTRGLEMPLAYTNVRATVDDGVLGHAPLATAMARRKYSAEHLIFTTKATKAPRCTQLWHGCSLPLSAPAIPS